MKFGADTDEFVLVKTRWGTSHGLHMHDGRLVYCRRNPATCKYCHEHGVPQQAPDPIDAMIAALRANWNARWAESSRHPGELAEDELWQAEGLHIVAIDEDTKARTVLVSFGDNDAASAAISALVHIHNEMIGQPDYA